MQVVSLFETMTSAKQSQQEGHTPKGMLHYERGALSDRECNHVVTWLGQSTLHWFDMPLPRYCCYVQGYCRTVAICSGLGAGMLQLKGLLAAFRRARCSSAEKS